MRPPYEGSAGEALLPASPSHALMIQSLEIEGFRCFDHAKLKGLSRINVVVGDSGSGKTSLLEAIFLAAGGNPQTVMGFRRWRGLGATSELGPSQDSFDALWGDVFHDFDMERSVSIALSGSPENSRILRIQTRRDAVLRIPLGEEAEQPFTIRPIDFDWIGPGNIKAHGEISANDKGVQFTQSREPRIRAHFLNSVSIFDSPSQAAKLLSNLRISKRDAKVVEAIREVYPEVEGISGEIFSGVSTIAVSIRGVKRLLPISLLSSGATKLAHILLAIADTKQGALLIDEIENGFHYTTLPNVWALMHQFAKSYGVQVFASTHSMECLRAAIPRIESDASEFSLIRSRRGGSLEHFDGPHLLAALHQDFEIR
jgi:predicted ATPase